MKCEACQTREATVHMVEMVNDQPHERHWCAPCRDQMWEKFEKVAVEGIGTLQDFEKLTIDEVRLRLPRGRYALYTATSPIPEGWPAEVMQFKKGRTQKDGQEVLVDVNVWQMNLDGAKWDFFYGFGTQLVEGLIPAFIYERKEVQGRTAYVPVVSMLVFPDGRVQQASKSWCEAVIADRLREQKKGA